MSNNELYIQVYEMIMTDIFNGKYTKGSRLPSLSSLCEQYKVGRNTIRSAMQLLEERGFIESQRGRTAVVVFDINEMASLKMYKISIYERKKTIEEIYKILEWMAPEIILAVKRKAGARFDEYLERMLRFDVEPNMNLQEEILVDRIYQVCTETIALLDNTLLYSLFQKLFRFIYIPVTKEVQASKRYLFSVKIFQEIFPKIVKFLSESNEYMLNKAVRMLCNGYLKSAMKHIERLGKDIENKEEITYVPFHWTGSQMMEYRYINVVVEIIRDISEGMYTDTIPSLQQIADRYGVSLKTARTACDKLEEFQIIQKNNGLKSKIVAYEKKNEEALLANEEVQKILLLYKESLQSLMLIVKGMNKEVLSSIRTEEIEQFLNSIKDEDKVMLDYMDFLFQHSNATMYSIYAEFKKQMAWSIYTETLFKEGVERHRFKEKNTEFMQAIAKKDYQTMHQYLEKVYQVAENDLPDLIQRHHEI